MKAIKIRIDQVNDSHVHLTMFSGDEGFTLHNNGHLCFGHDEYQVFHHCIGIGDQMYNGSKLIWEGLDLLDEHRVKCEKRVGLEKYEQEN